MIGTEIRNLLRDYGIFSKLTCLFFTLSKKSQDPYLVAFYSKIYLQFQGSPLLKRGGRHHQPWINIKHQPCP